MKEIKIEELSLKQKLGMTFIATLQRDGDKLNPEDDEFVYDLIRNRSLGAIWVQQGFYNTDEVIKKVKEIADYPIIIMTDAESGINDYLVGKHSAIGCTGSEKHAYAFGKTVGVKAREMGYNLVCNPVVDMIDGGQRSLGTDKEKVASLAVAMAKGMHDGGVLTLAKHYPGGSSIGYIDSHMAESRSADTKEELLSYSLYPYLKMMEQDLLDGIMTQHKCFINIDDKHPASLSKAVIDIIREQGFDGIITTDALSMMGIRAKFDDVSAKGIALMAGNDIPLAYSQNNKEKFEEYCQAYEKGMITDERLDEAVRRVLNAQHKTTLLPKDTSLTEEDEKTFSSINKDGIWTKTDDGVSHTISRDGKHFFALMVKNKTVLDRDGKVDVDTFTNYWHKPTKIEAKIKELFPNSTVLAIDEFPGQGEAARVLDRSLGHDEVIFITFSEALAYLGREYLTHRMVNIINAMQLTDRISTIVHFGNAHVLEELSHISRYIMGGLSEDSVDAALEVLAGEYPANGVPTYEVDLK